MAKPVCMVCGREVDGEDVKIPEDVDQINGAVIGEYIPIQGHTFCIRSVDNLVVIPNRIRVGKIFEEKN